VKTLAQYAAYLAEIIAALVIIVGSLRALWTYVWSVVLSRGGERSACMCRIQLGHTLSLALEFLVGADVLKTAVAPTWDDIGQLAAIIAIRTVLNFFLMWELEKVEKPDKVITE